MLFQLLIIFVKLIILHNGREQRKQKCSSAVLIFLQKILVGCCFGIYWFGINTGNEFSVCPVIDHHMQISGFAGIFRYCIIIPLAANCPEFFRSGSTGRIFHVCKNSPERGRMKCRTFLRLCAVFGIDILPDGIIRIIFKRFRKLSLERPVTDQVSIWHSISPPFLHPG